jgi:ribonuclease HIII
MMFTLIRAAKKRKKRKKLKRAAFDDSGNVTDDKVKRIRREVETKIREAQINCSTVYV